MRCRRKKVRAAIYNALKYEVLRKVVTRFGNTQTYPALKTPTTNRRAIPAFEHDEFTHEARPSSGTDDIPTGTTGFHDELRRKILPLRVYAGKSPL